MTERTVALEAEGHELIARGHAKLAEAARLRAPASTTQRPSWIPAADSPLGKRRTLALARCGAIDSSKVGRKVLIRRSSLEALIAAGQRSDDANDDEDLFGVKTVAAAA